MQHLRSSFANAFWRFLEWVRVTWRGPTMCDPCVAPPGLYAISRLSPTADAVGYVLPSLRDWRAKEIPICEGQFEHHRLAKCFVGGVNVGHVSPLPGLYAVSRSRPTANAVGYVLSSLRDWRAKANSRSIVLSAIWVVIISKT